MIPSSVVFSFIMAAVCTVFVPIAVLIVLGINKKVSALPLLFGALAFFISQMVLRMPLLSILSGQSWYQALSMRIFPYVLCLAFSAGLFEESARLGGALLLKKRRAYKDVISFGLGHAFCEVILLVGAAYASNALMCVLINNGASSMLPAEQLERAAARLAAVNPATICWGILERFSSVVFHIFATVLVFKGVTNKKIRYYFLAILAHTLLNLLAVLLARFVGIAVSEIVLLLAALAMGVYVLKKR